MDSCGDRLGLRSRHGFTHTVKMDDIRAGLGSSDVCASVSGSSVLVFFKYAIPFDAGTCVRLLTLVNRGQDPSVLPFATVAESLGGASGVASGPDTCFLHVAHLVALDKQAADTIEGCTRRACVSSGRTGALVLLVKPPGVASHVFFLVSNMVDGRLRGLPMGAGAGSYLVGYKTNTVWLGAAPTVVATADAATQCDLPPGPVPLPAFYTPYYTRATRAPLPHVLVPAATQTSQDSFEEAYGVD
jgi:hypothetical protein